MNITQQQSSLGWPIEESMSLIKYGKQFQKHRRMFQDHLSKTNCVSYRPIQIRGARVLLQNLLSDDKNHDAHVLR